MVWVKICGITNIEDADNAVSSGSDAVGLVFANTSLRKITDKQAIQIVSFLRDKFKDGVNDQEFDIGKKEIKNSKKIPSVVGVFVNEDIDEVVEKTAKLKLDFVQFSGDEDNKYLEDFRKKLNKYLKPYSRENNFKNAGKELENKIKSISLIKSIRVKNREEYVCDEIISKIMKIGSLADYFLLDKYSEETYGGTGETFDWGSIKNLGDSFPIILAGGLCPENVAEAIRTVNPFGVDVSSKLEVKSGKKDIEKIRSFIKNAKFL